MARVGKRVSNRLAARHLASLPAGKHPDGDGLNLIVDSGGSRRWAFIYARQGKSREMGLGRYPDVGLADARQARERWRKELAAGRDPITVREEERRAGEQARTFGECALALIESKGPGWRNPKHRAQWQTTLQRHAAPIWRKPVDEVDTAAVLSVLRPIWSRTPETAARVRGRIEAVLSAARAQGLAPRDTINPATWRGHLEAILPPARKLTRGHHAAMPYADVPAFMKALRARKGLAALALEFTILTAARSGEVRGATWNEIDLKAKVWTIPADRMKAGRIHRVPLVARAVKILEALADAKLGDLIFPGTRRDKPMSDMTLAAVLRRMKVEGVTVHGFRSSFRDWAGNETSFPRELAETALAHVAGDATEQAYRRSDALERRRALMEAWALYVGPETHANVLPLVRQAPR